MPGPKRARVLRRVGGATVLAILIALVVAHPADQGRPGEPDMSGDWRIEGATLSPDLPTTVSITQPLTTMNVFGEPMAPAYLGITIQRELPGGPRTDTYRIGVTGGAFSAMPPSDLTALRTHTDVNWNADALVISTGDYTGDRPHTGTWHEREERWRLQSHERLELAVTTDSSDAPRATASAVYLRR